MSWALAILRNLEVEVRRSGAPRAQSLARYKFFRQQVAEKRKYESGTLRILQLRRALTTACGRDHHSITPVRVSSLISFVSHCWATAVVLGHVGVFGFTTDKDALCREVSENPRLRA